MIGIVIIGSKVKIDYIIIGNLVYLLYVVLIFLKLIILKDKRLFFVKIDNNVILIFWCFRLKGNVLNLNYFNEFLDFYCFCF